MFVRYFRPKKQESPASGKLINYISMVIFALISAFLLTGVVYLAFRMLYYGYLAAAVIDTNPSGALCLQQFFTSAKDEALGNIRNQFPLVEFFADFHDVRCMTILGLIFGVFALGMTVYACLRTETAVPEYLLTFWGLLILILVGFVASTFPFAAAGVRQYPDRLGTLR